MSRATGHTGLSLGHETDREAEHWLGEFVAPLGLPGLVACTHLVREPRPHLAVSLSVPPPPGLPPSAPGLAGAAAGQPASTRPGDPAGRCSTRGRIG